jgi:hypothetical protein
MILGTDYQFRDEYKTDTVPIEILTGPHKGVIFRYLNVRVVENEDGTAKIGFGYDLLDRNGFTETTLANNKHFQEFLGLVLNQLILDVTEYDVANRKNDLDESIEERTVYEEGSSVSEG